MALTDILAHVRCELARRQSLRSLQAIQRDLTRSTRSLEDALRRPRTGFVMECKQASPSRGTIRADYDPVELASAYESLADGISVLTEEQFFGGSLAHLRAVSDAVSVPVLQKDFVLGPYQVFEARAHGADAVLLLLSVLDDTRYRRCAEVAESLALDVLTEVHDEDELRRAVDLGARIIGINNRNLVTLEVDLTQTERLAPLVPDDRVVICESGVGSHKDVARLRSLVDGFLVGTALSSRPDVARACCELVFGTVKVCGLTRPGDARAAADCGAVYGGLVFAPGSPRRVDFNRARTVRDGADLAWVGVFVNHDPRLVAETADALELTAVQLHGDETAGYVERLRDLLPAGCEVWKACRVRDQVPATSAEGSDRVVLDTYAATSRGGTGERFDWSLLAGVDLERALLAGGLDASCAAAAGAVGAFGLDVSSGVEREPGEKSRDRLDAFFEALRGRSRRGVHR
ncbi:MAG: bifunctional indole-3-glycerol-phosphate synthase TrpC/phosphoribosylanthranilate isomerase TrpF [Deltaproteobacteria bacterium]|nr:bifunctional indole-3-glycerol-phosphate synthase TrpC/phosphoribosylanthranilate isomerase TrpF [Deltaproteobacteria bacterium]